MIQKLIYFVVISLLAQKLTSRPIAVEEEESNCPHTFIDKRSRATQMRSKQWKAQSGILYSGAIRAMGDTRATQGQPEQREAWSEKWMERYVSWSQWWSDQWAMKCKGDTCSVCSDPSSLPINARPIRVGGTGCESVTGDSSSDQINGRAMRLVGDVTRASQRRSELWDNKCKGNTFSGGRDLTQSRAIRAVRQEMQGRNLKCGWRTEQWAKKCIAETLKRGRENAIWASQDQSLTRLSEKLFLRWKTRSSNM